MNGHAQGVFFTPVGINLSMQQVFALYDGMAQIDSWSANGELWIKKGVYVTANTDYPGIDIRKFFFNCAGTRIATRKGVHLSRAGWMRLKEFVTEVVHREELAGFVRCEATHMDTEEGTRCVLCE